MVDVVNVKFNDSGMETLKVTVGGRSVEDVESEEAKYRAAEAAEENGFNPNGKRTYTTFNEGRFDFYLQVEFYERVRDDK